MRSANISMNLSPVRSWATDMTIAIVGSLFIALCSQVSIPVSLSPVPFTLQAHAVFVTAYVLGAQRGFLAVSAFLMEGLFGMPVFAQGGFGPAVLFGPTGGYLLSYLGVSYLVGFLAEQNSEGSKRHAMGIFLLANLLVLACGGFVLSLFLGVGILGAWSMGVYPFLVTDLLKVLILVLAVPVWRKGALCLS